MFHFLLDIDECSAGHKCDINAVCNNTKASYNCTCKEGYFGDGRNCAGDINFAQMYRYVIVSEKSFFKWQIVAPKHLELLS